jgi:hypothetical protein
MVATYPTAQYHNLEYHNLNLHTCGNLTFHICYKEFRKFVTHQTLLGYSNKGGWRRWEM